MVLKRFYDEKLAQASYIVGCVATGETVVIDPIRNVEPYLSAAEADSLRITAVTETHIHADYLSGTRELAAKTGAKMFLSDEGGSDWRYAFRDDPNVTLVRDGDSIRVGNVRLDVVHTPGHTPEHISFILTDEPASHRPLGAFTGDFVFVGDVGRPDLLEKAANIKGTMELGGKQLYASLTSFRKYDDGLLIWPGHGAGSACGKSLGGVPVSSLGYEKLANWAFAQTTEEGFVNEVLSGQPEPPKYFAMMKRLNKQGPQIIGGFVAPTKMTTSEVLNLIEGGAQVVDLRDSTTAVTGFIPGTISIPEDKYFLRWAGWFLTYDSPVYLIANSEQQAMTAKKDLALIGLDDVQGWTDLSVLEAYASRAGSLASIESIDAVQIGTTSAKILDVRSTVEYDEGHVPGSLHIPLGYLADRLGELPQEGKIDVICGTGARSELAVILLSRLGIRNTCNVKGGFDAYKSVGREIEVAPASPEPVAK